MTACAPRIRSRPPTRIASRVGVAILLACAAPAQARVQPRVVGGSSAAITTFPFQVALWNPSESSPYFGQFCGGAIRDATHVVTAAHCVWDDASAQVVSPQSIDVLAGTSHLNDSGDPPYGSDVKNVGGSGASFDPAYGPSSADYDVAVLTLASPLYTGSPPAMDGTSTIAPIPLINSAQAQNFADPSVGSPVTVSGWGDTNAEPANGQPSPSYPQDLHAAQTHLVADSACQQDYPGQITARMICAGEPTGGVDGCFGDSGGPLVAQAHDSPAPVPPTDDVLVGLVDFGAGCAQAGFPGVYQRVVNDELSAFLTSDPPQAPQPTGSPTLSGSASPGQTLTCGTGAWAGNPSSFSYRFGRDLGPAGAVALTQPSTSNGYTVQPGDTGTRIFCEVRAANAGGYGYADSDDVTVGGVGQGSIGSTPGPTAPALTSSKDTKPPTLGVVVR